MVSVISTIIALLLLGSLIALFRVKVPFVPTPKKNIQKTIDTFDLQPGQIFYDLGCGDGRFLIEAEKHGVVATGFEISPWAYFKCLVNLIIHKSKANVKFKNFYQEDLSKADAVVCFLLIDVMPKVEKKLLQELRSGAKVVSYGFEMPSWKPVKIIETNTNNKKASKIYMYIKS